ncbi:MAG: beta-lactamase family protein [Acidobacteria bacterium]|nr:beta-lactamase family protein [Acidobacteriota bacterium]
MKTHLMRPFALLRYVLIVLLLVPAQAQTLPKATPEEVGLSTERLQRINEVIQRYMESNQISGAVTLVARKGRVAHYEAHGLMDIEAKTPIRKDAMFRMASSTKPVAGVAIMMLMEEGKVRLSDPVSRFIPEFKNPKVAIPKPSIPAPVVPGQSPPVPEITTIAATREITVRDLLTHTSGLGSGGASAGEAAKVMQSRKPTDALADFIPRLGALPLDFQPGTQFRYSGLAGIDVLSRIVEIASGQTFDQFLKTRIFDPLGMKDTFFALPTDRQNRLMTLYRRAGNKLEKHPNQEMLMNRIYFSGAAGLVSTAEDYFQFAQMLANGGQLNGKRLLSPRTVALMSSNHTGELFPGQLGRPAGMGFGFTVEVVADAIKADSRRSVGSFGWDGAFGTHFWVDPKEQLVAVLMIQTANRGLHRDFENAVMQAIVE